MLGAVLWREFLEGFFYCGALDLWSGVRALIGWGTVTLGILRVLGWVGHW